MIANNQYSHYWTEKEEEIISEHYLKGDEHLHKLLPHRTIQAIKSHRIKILRINPNSKFWEDWEEEIIKEHYLKGDKYLHSLLPNRSIPSIKQHRLNILHLMNHFYNKRSLVWRKNKKNIIEDHVDNELGPAEISKKYGIHLSTLTVNLKKAGVYKSRPKKRR